jgi:L-lactate dehydrogenase complex protein LldG
MLQQANGCLSVRTYAAPVEAWKQELFNDIEVGITGTLGAISTTGTLIICPDVDEPRLMSLAPPVHIALVDSEKIYRNLGEAITDNGWSSGMPTNLLLISGPSKTADIEQILTYGIHGPQQLIVLIK